MAAVVTLVVFALLLSSISIYKDVRKEGQTCWRVFFFLLETTVAFWEEKGLVVEVVSCVCSQCVCVCV